MREVAPNPGDTTGDVHPDRWRMLALLALAELLGMSLWFAGNAVAPQLRSLWNLSGAQVGWLTTAVQLGFVAGTGVVAILNLADIIPSRTLFSVAAVLGAAANLALLAADGFFIAVVTRFACGFCLAGVYPPAMKMIATWFRARRGLAVGTIVGALTVGKATPYLVHAFPTAGVDAIVISGSVSAAMAAALVWLGYREGPYPFPPRPFSWSLVSTVARSPQWRLATGGYLGHMFELYSYWTWIPAFLAASAARHAGSATLLPVEERLTYLLAFGTIAIGGFGCLWGGLVADRLGRERLVIIAMAISGVCALLIGATFGRGWLLVAPIALAWGFFVIADSAQFSVLITESVPPHAVGTALMLQTSIGFLLTTVSIQLVPPLVRAAGWAWAFPLLAMGPIAGIAAIRRLLTLKARMRAHTINADSAAPSAASSIPSITT
ncbi:MAG TPA: MFS transporter [Gemmatimonadaceae bacterium]|nr:MFS transporter [Gemmatimonadaceae bacterium]